MKGIKQFILVLSLVVPVIPGTAMSNLPLAVNGNELPSLAPMVEKTRPAVVNIATRGKVDVQNHPLLNDPFFIFRKIMDINMIQGRISYFKEHISTFFPTI